MVTATAMKSWLADTRMKLWRDDFFFCFFSSLLQLNVIVGDFYFDDFYCSMFVLVVASVIWCDDMISVWMQLHQTLAYYPIILFVELNFERRWYFWCSAHSTNVTERIAASLSEIRRHLQALLSLSLFIKIPFPRPRKRKLENGQERLWTSERMSERGISFITI